SFELPKALSLNFGPTISFLVPTLGSNLRLRQNGRSFCISLNALLAISNAPLKFRALSARSGILSPTCSLVRPLYSPLRVDILLFTAAACLPKSLLRASVSHQLGYDCENFSSAYGRQCSLSHCII